ncbi:hypothetical protein BDF19DRAFT_465895 [Syncephalis fuscata]|nr:hypothetical protein BDF19DRAFT_465895 [Syncephalis fuscata]
MPYDLTRTADTRHLRIAYASDYEERAGNAGTAIAAEDLENHGYALLELDETLERALTSDTEGRPKDEAVLCTPSVTFALRRVEWSNTLLLADTEEKNNHTTDTTSIDNSMEVTEKTPQPVTIQAALGHLLEARQIRPNTARLRDLTSRVNAVWDGVSLLNKAAALTLDELRSEIQASDDELAKGLLDYDIVQLEDQGYRRIASEHVCHTLASIFTTFAAEGIIIEENTPVTPQQCFTLMGLEAQNAPLLMPSNAKSDIDSYTLSIMIIRHCFCKFATVQSLDSISATHTALVYNKLLDNVPHVFVAAKVCRYIGHEIFRQHTGIHYEENEFIKVWSESGICISDDDKNADNNALTKPKLLHYLPIDELAQDPAARLRALFDIRPRWQADELRIYLADIAIASAQIDSWLMKFARRVTATGAAARNKRKPNGDTTSEQTWYCARLLGTT